LRQVYSLLYGLFVINILDLTVRGFWGYHLFLILLYFLPFLAVGLVVGFEHWKLPLGLGLLTSLMNDLFYGFIGNALGWTHYQLKQGVAWSRVLRNRRQVVLQWRVLQDTREQPPDGNQHLRQLLRFISC